VRGVDVLVHVRDCDLRATEAARPAVGVEHAIGDSFIRIMPPWCIDIE
jgi:hypothetical protein